MAPAPYHDFTVRRMSCRQFAVTGKRIAPSGRRAFMTHGESIVLSEQSAREHVIPTYMGLVREIDDHMAGWPGCCQNLDGWTIP
ncbi:MAG: hypothetical protein Ct9H300mP16_17890 [Pseudomonadota bacterium]|nr:MAG: hypothetical protein Ct9H300mP16_17890 [Pseudomonadota bacterium]